MPIRFSPNAGAAAINLAATSTPIISLDALLGSTVGLFAVRGADGWEQRAIVGDDLPNPSTTTLGGVFSRPEDATHVMTGIDNSGNPQTDATTGTGDVVRSAAPSVTGAWALAGTLTITSASASAFAVGRLGLVTPALSVDASAANSITGIAITSQASGNGVNITGIGETNVPLIINGAGSGTINFGTSSTGAISFFRQANFMVGGFNVLGATAGLTNVIATGVASGTLTLPAATDTLIGKATTDALTNKTFNTQGTGNVFTLNGAAFGTQAEAISALKLLRPNVTASAVNFNSGNTDTTITLPSPPSGFTRYSIRAVFISGPSGTLASATCGLFTATGAGGVALVASGTAVTITTASDSTANNMQVLSPVNVNTMSNLYSALTSGQIYFRVQTASAGVNTANVTVEYQWLP